MLHVLPFHVELGLPSVALVHAPGVYAAPVRPRKSEGVLARFAALVAAKAAARNLPGFFTFSFLTLRLMGMCYPGTIRERVPNASPAFVQLRSLLNFGNEPIAKQMAARIRQMVRFMVFAFQRLSKPICFLGIVWVVNWL